MNRVHWTENTLFADPHEKSERLKYIGGEKPSRYTKTSFMLHTGSPKAFGQRSVEKYSRYCTSIDNSYSQTVCLCPHRGHPPFTADPTVLMCCSSQADLDPTEVVPTVSPAPGSVTFPPLPSPHCLSTPGVPGTHPDSQQPWRQDSGILVKLSKNKNLLN